MELFNVLLEKTLKKEGCRSSVKVGKKISLYKIIILPGEQIIGIFKFKHKFSDAPKFVRRPLTSPVREYTTQVSDNSLLIETKTSFYTVTAQQAN
jgi:hypothetical protein